MSLPDRFLAPPLDKHPDAIREYGFDFSLILPEGETLASIDSVTITRADGVAIGAGDLAERTTSPGTTAAVNVDAYDDDHGRPVAIGTAAIVWLHQGVRNRNYLVDVLATFSGGESDAGTFPIHVRGNPAAV